MELAAEELRACCASPRWVDAMLAGAPYPDRDAVLQAADRALAELDWAELRRALAGHPRIGDRVPGNEREAHWSRAEQSAAVADDGQATALAAADRAYERRFGHVFLVCVTGLSVDAVLATLRERLGNDPATEREVVRGELGRIVRLRLAKVVTGR
jgi:2-oxo-4-hydroxy-4-carboxy-5-ureidoimidazoline decarboxylase